MEKGNLIAKAILENGTVYWWRTGRNGKPKISFEDPRSLHRGGGGSAAADTAAADDDNVLSFDDNLYN